MSISGESRVSSQADQKLSWLAWFLCSSGFWAQGRVPAFRPELVWFELCNWAKDTPACEWVCPREISGKGEGHKEAWKLSANIKKWSWPLSCSQMNYNPGLYKPVFVQVLRKSTQVYKSAPAGRGLQSCAAPRLQDSDVSVSVMSKHFSEVKL